MRVFIGLDYLVHRALHEGFAEVFGRGEVAGVQVAFAGAEQVYQHQQADGHGGNLLAAEACEGLGVFRLSLRQEGPQEQSGGGHDEQQGAGGIGLEKGDTVLHQGLHQHILHLGVSGRFEAAEKSGRKPGQQAKAAGEAESPSPGLPETVFIVCAPRDAVQRHEAQQGQRHLQHH